MSLSNQTCEACRTGAQAVETEEQQQLLQELPEWQVLKREGVPQLERAYVFKNFVAALAFTNKIGELAEQENHHPAIITEWGKVTVAWWTHKISGLHKNDFIMAARTDKIA